MTRVSTEAIFGMTADAAADVLTRQPDSGQSGPGMLFDALTWLFEEPSPQLCPRAVPIPHRAVLASRCCRIRASEATARVRDGRPGQAAARPPRTRRAGAASGVGSLGSRQTPSVCPKCLDRQRDGSHHDDKLERLDNI